MSSETVFRSTSRGLLMDSQHHISCAPRQVLRCSRSVSPLTLTNLVAGTYQFYCVALRTISGFGGSISSPPSILSDTLSLPHSSEAASLTGEFTVDVNLTSCEALDAAVTRHWWLICSWIFLPSVSHWLAAPTEGRFLCFVLGKRRRPRL